MAALKCQLTLLPKRLSTFFRNGSRIYHSSTFLVGVGISLALNRSVTCYTRLHVVRLYLAPHIRKCRYSSGRRCFVFPVIVGTNINGTRLGTVT